MKLNIGSEKIKIDGFKNVDIQDFPGVDFVCDARRLEFAKDGEIEEIYSSNLLEHFTYFEMPEVLKDWHRAMKSGARLSISVPDMPSIVEYINRYGWNQWIGEIVYGITPTYPKHSHKSGWDFDLLRKFLLEAGFIDIYRVEKFLYSDKDCSNCKMRDTLHNYEESIVLNIICKKP